MHHVPIQGLEPSVFGEQKLKKHPHVPIQGLEPSVFGEQKLKMHHVPIQGLLATLTTNGS
jgi:hypothetical protein